jgi:sterol desaturase/sphingolipid hydroxylase (fatty acid hydroxylase superfamily)
MGRAVWPGRPLLRAMLVTPDMHRVHHSADPTETDTNFGFTLSWWDRLLGTSRAQPKAGTTRWRSASWDSTRMSRWVCIAWSHSPG